MYKTGLPGKLILGYYFQENRTSQRPFLLPRISFPGRPIFIQSVPEADLHDEVAEEGDGGAASEGQVVGGATGTKSDLGFVTLGLRGSGCKFAFFCPLYRFGQISLS